MLANAILESCVRADIDLTAIHAFPDDYLRAHAIGPVLRAIDPAAVIPVVPIFVNAIHEPAPSPARCFHVGETIRSAVEACGGVGPVCIYASGGLSHYTAGYPWRRYRGDTTHGAIDEAFDRGLIAAMLEDRGSDLARLSSDDLLRHGDIEFRTWLVALGALRGATTDFIEYQPFYRGLMGMFVSAWTGQSNESNTFLSGATPAVWPGVHAADVRRTGDVQEMLTRLVSNTLSARYAMLARIRPVLENLVGQVGEAVHVAMRNGTMVTYIDCVESRKSERATPRTGRVMPAYATASGKALFAHLSPADLEALFPSATLVPLTQHTISSRAALSENLREQKSAALRRMKMKVSSDSSPAAVSFLHPIRRHTRRQLCSPGRVIGFANSVIDLPISSAPPPKKLVTSIRNRSPSSTNHALGVHLHRATIPE